PTRNSLMVKVFFRAHSDKITPYLYVNPHIANTGSNDKAWLDNNFWYAQDGDTSMTLATDAQVNQSSVGFVGVSDGLTQIEQHGRLTETYQSTGDTTGNVAITLQLPTLNQETAEWQFVLGFGNAPNESRTAAQQTLHAGYAQVLANYNGTGAAIGWEDYLQSLPQLQSLAQTATDGGKLLYA